MQFGDPQFYPGANNSRSSLQTLGQNQHDNNTDHSEPYSAPKVDWAGSTENDLNFFTDIQNATAAARDNDDDEASTNSDASPSKNPKANMNIRNTTNKENTENVPKSNKSMPARGGKKVKPTGKDTKSKKGGLGSKSGVLIRGESESSVATDKRRPASQQ